jgi:hypothetical protein
VEGEIRVNEIEVDRSLIGPLSDSRISDEPVSWRAEGAFRAADNQAQQYVDREAAVETAQARRVLMTELQHLVDALARGEEPRSVLHGVAVWGPISITRLSGFMRRSLDEVSDVMEKLELVGVCVPGGTDEFAAVEYVVNPSAEIFAKF